MKKQVFHILLCFCALTGIAQQVPLFNSYYNNPLLYNPAMAGSAEHSTIYLIHRSQWSDIPGAPVADFLTLDGPIKEKNIGLGLGLTNDSKGLTRKTGISSFYAYHLKISDLSKLFFGFSLGVIDQKIDFSRMVVKDLNDPSLFYQERNRTALDASLGVVYLWKKMQLGFSAPQILGNKLKYIDNNTTASYDLSRHYVASVKHTFDIDPKELAVSPLLLLRYVPGAPFQYDIGAVTKWRETAWLGISYKSKYAVSINAGAKLNKRFNIGYGYDIITSSIRAYSGASHELMLGFIFGGEKKTQENLNKQYEEEIARLNQEITKMQQDSSKRYDDKIAKLSEELNLIRNNPDKEYRKQIAELSEQVKKREDELFRIVDLYFISLPKLSQEEAVKGEAEIDKLKEDISNYKIAVDDTIKSLRAKMQNVPAINDDIITGVEDAGAPNSVTTITTTTITKEGPLGSPAITTTTTTTKGGNSRTISNTSDVVTTTVAETRDTLSNDKSLTGGNIRTGATSDFSYAKSAHVPRGYYIIIGSFRSKELAEKLFIKVMKGEYTSSDIMFNEKNKFYYVYVIQSKNLSDARSELFKVREKFSDAWIQVLY